MEYIAFAMHLGDAIHSVKTKMTDEIFFWDHYPWNEDPRFRDLVQNIELGARVMGWKEQSFA
jgi:hypothetical protein